MDELKPATSQLVQDAGDVAGTQEPDQHQECPGAVVDRHIVDSACDLGVVIDSRLTMPDQVIALCRAGYITSCVSCVQRFEHFQMNLPKLLSRRS